MLFTPNKCILCGSVDVDQSIECSSDSVIIGWRESFGIDVGEYFRDNASVFYYYCNSCKLKFYDPRLAGRPDLYAKLQQHDFYYMHDKWEHREALNHVADGSRVVEIGCGEGAFLMMLRHSNVKDTVGLELNPQALKKARLLGLNIESSALNEFAFNEAGSFDVVCHFQVLEHVPDPDQFIKHCVDLLSPGGQLIVAVPNGSGFLKYAKMDLLNMPPHHISFFSEATLSRIGDLFGLKLLGILREPLAEYHLRWFCNAHIDRIPRIRFVTWPLIGPLRKLLYFVLRTTRLYRLFKGHTVMAIYQKNAAAK